MQAQCTSTTTQAITSAQSLAAVQTLLRAGLGCIAYVRNLLPADNFSQSHFTSEDDSVATQSSASENGSRQTVNGFKIMTMSRGYTDEADKILNYLELGIFDALEKQYLRSFIFGIYLDSKDPTNIVEAYTFNFHYYQLPGSNNVIPIMSLDEGIKQLSLGGRDPLAEAVKTGKTPTIRDVKRSVKRLLKTLIHTTNNMEALPKRRFATFKLFYTDKTPADYEPPNFRPGDLSKDKWYFMTHDLDEVPEKWSLGSVETGHHSVDVTVRSVISYLPSSTDDDDAPFTGTVAVGQGGPKLTPVQEANVRVQEAEQQLKDAEHRNIAWRVDSISTTDADADGEDDPDYADSQPANPLTTVDENHVPAGIRDKEGNIVPIVPSATDTNDCMDIDEAHFGGVSETVPSHVGQLRRCEVDQGQTQRLEQTQPLSDPALLFSRSSSTCVPSDATPDASKRTASSVDETGSICPDSDGVTPADDTLVFGEMGDQDNLINDSEMLDMETQVIPPETHDSIETYDTQDTVGRDSATPKPTGRDNGLHCACKIQVEDDHLCFCEGGCHNWFHVWCMGYHSGTDPRLPTKFVCFDCRVHADPNWELLAVELYPRMVSRFNELATSRRAIKVVEERNPDSERAFIKAMECDNDHGHQLFKWLQDRDIICQQVTTIDEMGLVETQPRNQRERGRGRSTRGRVKAKQPKRTLKPQYAFNKAFLKTSEYADYFNPDPKIERKLLNIPELDFDFSAKSRMGLLTSGSVHGQDIASQTQETAPISFQAGKVDNGKRGGQEDDSNARLTKRIKISLATGVDLAE